MYDPLEKPYDELQKVLQSFVKKGNEEEAEALKNNKQKQQQQQQQQRHKCVKDAEAAALAALRQHKASESPTAGGCGEEPSTTTTNNTTTIPSISTADSITSSKEGEGSGGGEQSFEDLQKQPMPQTFDEAMDRLNKLKTMRDDLLAEQDRNNKFVERYQEKVAKSERMATLHNLIPRQLFVREDRYNEELEKVYKWSGISDQEIADIYRRKLGDIKHHGASIVQQQQNKRDPYQNFRDIPDFGKVNGKPVSSSSYSSYNNVLRNLEFMKKIASGGGNN
jgi:hypothetical protein